MRHTSRAYRAASNWAAGMAINAIVALVVAIGIVAGWIVIP